MLSGGCGKGSEDAARKRTPGHFTLPSVSHGASSVALRPDQTQTLTGFLGETLGGPQLNVFTYQAWGWKGGT